MRVFSLGCVWMAVAVALGAFGAHALKASLTPDRLAVWETAVRYQAYAALGLQVAGLRVAPALGPKLLLLGSLVFSGSLYLLCLTEARWLGAITPLGGLAMIAGWLALAWQSGQGRPGSGEFHE